jgi:opacity protein-like surface antigen
MKESVHRLICVGGLLLLCPVASQAQVEKLYIRADAGGNLTHNTELKEFFGESLAPNSKVKFDPGVRFGIAAGYQLTDWFAPELQTGIMANSIESITDASRVDAVFSNVPLLGGVRLQCPYWQRFQPYLGGGAGASFPVLDADRITIGGTSIHGSDADAVFAYHAFGGLRFKLNDRMGLGLEYHYFHADGARWEADFTSDKMRMGGTETHAVSIAFDFHF